MRISNTIHVYFHFSCPVLSSKHTLFHSASTKSLFDSYTYVAMTFAVRLLATDCTLTSNDIILPYKEPGYEASHINRSLGQQKSFIHTLTMHVYTYIYHAWSFLSLPLSLSLSLSISIYLTYSDVATCIDINYYTIGFQII